jgi:hypothetical protein
MCKQKEICPLVSVDSNDRERVKYDTALEALQAARKYNREYLKYSQVRYCPACKSWHITTKGTGCPGVSANLETGTILIGEDFTKSDGRYCDLSTLAFRGEKLRKELEFSLKVKPLLGGINLKKCSSSELIKISSNQIKGISEVMVHQIYAYCDEKVSYRIRHDFDEIKSELQKLAKSRDRREKGILIRGLSELAKRSYYINMIYPDFRDQLEAEIQKYK